jgi:hypothetical protein
MDRIRGLTTRLTSQRPGYARPLQVIASVIRLGKPC